MYQNISHLLTYNPPTYYLPSYLLIYIRNVRRCEINMFTIISYIDDKNYYTMNV